MKPTRREFLAGTSCISVGLISALSEAATEEKPSLPRAFIDGAGAGWKAMAEDDFANVNCDDDTWAWKDGVIHCTGKPVGVMQSRKPYKNFELVVQWRHLRSGGNSGVFVWA
ncbi:MAG: family 16 glycoside hydrolase, partial [Phycisphaerae bacterium]